MAAEWLSEPKRTGQRSGSTNQSAFHAACACWQAPQHVPAEVGEQAGGQAGGFEGRLCVEETVATELSEHDFILQLALGERNFLPLQEVRCLRDAEQCSVRKSQKFSPMGPTLQCPSDTPSSVAAFSRFWSK